MHRTITTDRGFPLWKKSALATAAALALLGAHPNAHALALGAVQVKSALGEPLRAEVEVPDITADEASTFQAALGTPQEFQAAGVDFSQALRGARITLSHRPNGQAYLQVQGQQPVNEPFLTLVIDANWANGHVVRDYTLLIDPPRPQAAASAAPPARQESAPVVASPPRPSSAHSGAVTEPAAAPGAFAASGTGEQVHVQPGDTAVGLAETFPVEGVSLDQMLVAMLRANPRAFIHGNVNLIRAGAVVNMPNAQQSAAVSPVSAHRMVIAQSRDFHAFRQGLAMAVAHGSRMRAGRHSAAGSVQSQVQETGVAPTPPDRLTLSRGRSAGQAAGSAGHAETHIAQSRQAQEQAAREAELRRNINDLSKLAGASGDTAAQTPASAAQPSAPAINIPASATVPAAQGATATAPAASAQAAVTASAAAHQARPVAVPHPVVTPAPSEPSLLDGLLDNWPMLGGVAATILLLLGYGYHRSKQKERKSNETALNSEFLSEGKQPPDSYFGASGGQRVDTRDGENTDAQSSSMTYSPSQLEAVGDVDPVSEADVYLAYGRDAQAEEILKEALRTYPGRTSIYLKLAEIYAKQRSTHQLEAIATEARRVTHGEGHDWQTIVNLGREIDPDNALYASGDMPMIVNKTPVASSLPAAGTGAKAPDRGSAGSKDGLDLDLTDNAPLSTPVLQAAPQTPSGELPTAQAPVHYIPTVPASLPMSNDAIRTKPLPLTSSTAPTPDAGDFDFTPPAAPPQGQPNTGMIEFDTSGLAVGQAAHPAQPDSKPDDEDPLATKLALAQEFHAIGDSNSARALVKEVLAEASGTLKTKAQQLLNDLG